MHPEIGKVRMYRRSDGQSTRLEDPNNLSFQYTATDITTRDPPLHGPITGGRSVKGGGVCAYIYRELGVRVISNFFAGGAQ